MAAAGGAASKRPPSTWCSRTRATPIFAGVATDDLRVVANELEEEPCFAGERIFDDLPRSATAHVIEDALLLALDKANLRALVLQYPELALGLLKGLSLRLRDANLRAR
jgi:CRP-like cAMP-binding protein